VEASDDEPEREEAEATSAPEPVAVAEETEPASKDLSAHPLHGQTSAGDADKGDSEPKKPRIGWWNKRAAG